MDLAIKPDPNTPRDKNAKDKKLFQIKMVLILLSVSLILGACTANTNSDRYYSSEINQVQSVERGVVESWREVEVRTDTGGGTTIGVGAGAVTGAAIGGRGSSGLIGALVGGVLGGLVGSDIDKSVGTKRGFEYIIVTPENERLSIVDVSERPIPVGAPVILQLGSRTRIRLDESRIVS